MFDAKGVAMKGRIELFFVAALACQSLVTSLMAADQTGVASVYSTESGSKTASGEKLNPEAPHCRSSHAAVRHEGKGKEQAERTVGGRHHQGSGSVRARQDY